MNEKIKALHNEAIELARTHARCEVRLISLLQEFDRYKGYMHFGVKSLFSYCTEVLKLSEATTYNLTTVSRKSVQVPELKSAIEKGELTLSKARKIVPVITKENKSDWLSLAVNSTSREIEKAVAKAQPQLAVKESVKYVSEDRVAITVGLSEQTLEKLKRVMDLECQRSKRSATQEDALNTALDSYLEKHDPVRKAERVILKSSKKQATHQPVPGQVQHTTVQKPKTYSTKSVTRRVTIHSALIHAVHMRDQRQCTYTQNNTRCGATRWLDIHHIIPRALGGADTLENLTTVCSAHHRFIHLHD